MSTTPSLTPNPTPTSNPQTSSTSNNPSSASAPSKPEPLPPFPNPNPNQIYTLSPNPTFTPRQKVGSTERGREWIEEGEKAGFREFVIGREDPGRMYQLMKSGIVPRPVAFISSISEDGVENLAPFSFFNQCCPDPPIISFCANTSPRMKDTPRNVRTRGFTINIISEPWTEQANMGSIDAPEGVSEWEVCGLTKVDSIYVPAPRVKESAFVMECEFYQSIDILHPSTQTLASVLTLAIVKCIHVRNDIFNERGYVDPVKLRPVARLGDISFGSVGPFYRMPAGRWGDLEGEGKDEGEGKV